MKIQDIFKLPNTKGKDKLLNRIMNRYGISKEDSKELKTNIDNFSSRVEGSNIEYFAYNLNSLPILVMVTVSQLLKASIQVQSQDNIIQVIAAGPNMYVFEKLQTTSPEILAIGVDLNTKFAVKDIDGSSEMFVLLDFLLESFTKEEIAALPRITKEEFYKLD